MSTFVASLYNYLRRLHYLGRNFSGAAHVEVWFGGTKMSVTELLYIVAEEFNVSKIIYYFCRKKKNIKRFKCFVFLYINFVSFFCC